LIKWERIEEIFKGKKTVQLLSISFKSLKNAKMVNYFEKLEVTHLTKKAM